MCRVLLMSPSAMPAMPEMKLQPPGLDPFQWFSYLMNVMFLSPVKKDDNGLPKAEVPEVSPILNTCTHHVWFALLHFLRNVPRNLMFTLPVAECCRLAAVSLRSLKGVLKLGGVFVLDGDDIVYAFAEPGMFPTALLRTHAFTYAPFRVPFFPILCPSPCTLCTFRSLHVSEW